MQKKKIKIKNNKLKNYKKIMKDYKIKIIKFNKIMKN